MSESGSGSLSGWVVEARWPLDTPKVVNGVVLAKKWQQLGFPRAPVGVPRGDPWHEHWLNITDRYSYQAAQALRWWWLAKAGVFCCADTRLVRYEITYSYSTERKGSGHVEGSETTRYVDKLDTEEAPEVVAGGAR